MLYPKGLHLISKCNPELNILCICYLVFLNSIRGCWRVSFSIRSFDYWSIGFPYRYFPYQIRWRYLRSHMICFFSFSILHMIVGILLQKCKLDSARSLLGVYGKIYVYCFRHCIWPSEMTLFAYFYFSNEFIGTA